MVQFGNITNSGKAKVSSYYGPRNIGPGRSKNHKGIDISYPSGTQITSPLDGVVERAASNAGNCGGLIIINHGEFNGKNVKSKYCHVKRLDVSKDKKVKKGEVVGLSGGAKGDVGRGNSTGAHIHFEILENGKNVNPLSYYQSSISGEQSDITVTPDKQPNSKPDSTNGGYEIKIPDGDDDGGDDDSIFSKKDSENKTKDIAKQVVKKILGIESINPKSNNKVVNEIKAELERFNFLIKEQVSVVDSQTVQQTSDGTYYKGSVNSVVKSIAQGKVEKLTNLNGYDVGVKIGNTEMYWKGTLVDGLNQISAGTTIGKTTDGGVFTRVVKTDSTNTKNQNNPVTNVTKSVTNNSQTTTTTDKDQGSKDIVKGVVKQMLGQNESVEKSEDVLNEEINRIKNLIK
jgi:hypothetical protein